MVICDDCKLKGTCSLKKSVLASGGNFCTHHAVQTLEKTAQEEEYTVSWTIGNKRIVQLNKGGRVISSKTEILEK